MVVAASHHLLTLLAWLFLLAGAGTSHGLHRHERLADAASAAAGLRLEWTALYWLAAFCIMGRHDGCDDARGLPMVLLYGRVVRYAEPRPRLAATSSILPSPRPGFSLWILFSLLAVAAQWA
jgi:hypothetical protein